MEPRDATVIFLSLCISKQIGTDGRMLSYVKLRYLLTYLLRSIIQIDK